MTRGLASCGYSPPPGVLRDYRQVRDRLSTRKALYGALTTCYINSILSQIHTKRACEILGIHCAMIPVVFPRSRGAASPIYYWTKRELLETGHGDDVGWGSDIALISSLSLLIALGLRRSSSSSRMER
ncbi:hypothetical protein FIBSPDRAFT_231083 [Athelia psychrophila]|uniref:Uncharacterized protein n=1 Tax=Athelia psychrophila TaxID=1759441 RepID=A0A165YNR1_9AGAM|nr:hypothetical protein FIBSPDRAFT_231083 [Fibularhizoctonia sp. CBS 109695]